MFLKLYDKPCQAQFQMFVKNKLSC